MRRTFLHLRRHSVAYVALFFALGGTSYAAATKLLPANSVGTRQVINHSLLRKDFVAGQLPRGAPGDQGPTGPKGDYGGRGPTGPSGVSTAYAGELISPQVLKVPDAYGPIARIFLPAGNFVLFASASFNNPGTGKALVECYVAIPNGQESTLRAVTLGPSSPSANYEAASIAVQTIVTQQVAGYHSLECRDNGGSVQIVSVPQSEITAIQIDEVRHAGP